MKVREFLVEWDSKDLAAFLPVKAFMIINVKYVKLEVLVAAPLERVACLPIHTSIFKNSMIDLLILGNSILALLF